jgi:predicted nicotinamide N-methyase
MGYPNSLTEIENGFSIYIPDSEELKKHYEKLYSLDSNTPFPFWGKIWPSAKALTIFLRNNPDLIKFKTVLEIGAGIGLPSFSIADKASEIIITDHSMDAVDLIQKNIDHLELKNSKALYFDWNNFSKKIRADTILLSDINYDPSQIDQLASMLNHFLKNNSTIIIATPERITATPFGNAIQPHFKKSFLQDIEESEKKMQIRIMLL